jgi:hypothetical protein
MGMIKSPERMLFLAFMVILVGSTMPHTTAQTFLTVPAPAPSGPNELLDFYAGGSSDSYSLQVSPQGGKLTVGDYLSMGLMPWKYVTAQWSTGTVYIVFLVNVTQTNFRIGFLYLTNSSDQPFILRMYDYASNNIQLWTFQGIQHIYNRTTTTASVSLPKLQIPASAKVTNGLSALGPELWVHSTGGEWLNGTNALTIYPLYNQYFSGPTDYNELWSLLADSAGNYYFAVLYMQNSDKSHVIIEHQLRLNDYTRLNGRTVIAKWALGDFVDQVTVRTAVPSMAVKVDGFPFQTNEQGVVSTTVPSGYATIEVPSQFAKPDNSRLTFTSWNTFGNTNPLRILMNSSVDLTAKFNLQYQVAVNSTYGSPQGSGWYPPGSNVTYAVNSPLDFGNGTRRTFVQWSGDSKSDSPQSSLIVNSAKQLNANWKTQYELTLSAPGLPPNATANVLVGTLNVQLTGATPATVWVDANQQLSITVQNQHVQAPNGNYSFSELRADNQTFAGMIVMNQPVTIWLMYAATPSSSPAAGIALSASPQPPTSSDQVLSFLEYGLLVGKNIPALTPMISFTASIAHFGYALAQILMPGGPAIAGYLLGSLFVGLIYILPVAAFGVLYRSGRTRRQPSLRALTPLAVIWIIALTLIVLSSNIGVLQSIVAALQVLLIITTMLLFPLVIAFRIAKLAA